MPCHAMPEVHDAALGAYSFVQGAAFELSVLAITENAQGGVNNEEQKLIENPDNAEASRA